VQSKYGVFQVACTPRKSGLEVAKTLSFELTSVEEPRVAFLLRADNALLQSLLLRRAANENPQYAAVQSLFEMLPDPANLEVVMDVELDVTLRFGQRHLTLREVLDLTSGSVVELDRQVDEPVELVLDGRVIARGEAVVVDGNYGLRVTEVPHALGRQLPA
jgi:flagellar motor switch protein FliN